MHYPERYLDNRSLKPAIIAFVTSGLLLIPLHVVGSVYKPAIKSISSSKLFESTILSVLRDTHEPDEEDAKQIKADKDAAELSNSEEDDELPDRYFASNPVFYLTPIFAVVTIFLGSFIGRRRKDFAITGIRSSRNALLYSSKTVALYLVLLVLGCCILTPLGTLYYLLLIPRFIAVLMSIALLPMTLVCSIRVVDAIPNVLGEFMLFVISFYASYKFAKRLDYDESAKTYQIDDDPGFNSKVSKVLCLVKPFSYCRFVVAVWLVSNTHMFGFNQTVPNRHLGFYLVVAGICAVTGYGAYISFRKRIWFWTATFSAILLTYSTALFNLLEPNLIVNSIAGLLIIASLFFIRTSDTAMEEISKEEPYRWKSYRLRSAEQLAKLRYRDATLQELRKAIGNSPNAGELSSCARLLIENDYRKEAIDFLDEAIQQDPHGDERLTRAYLRLSFGNQDGALEDFESFRPKAVDLYLEELTYAAIYFFVLARGTDKEDCARQRIIEQMGLHERSKSTRLKLDIEYELSEYLLGRMSEEKLIEASNGGNLIGSMQYKALTIIGLNLKALGQFERARECFEKVKAERFHHGKEYQIACHELESGLGITGAESDN